MPINKDTPLAKANWERSFRANFRERVGGDWEDITGREGSEILDRHWEADTTPKDAVTEFISDNGLDDLTAPWLGA